MINEYVDNVELKRLFEDKLLTPENTRYFYKKRGILMASQKPDDLADQAYTIFLGTSDIQELQDMMNVDGSYIQSAVFQLECTAYNPDSFIEELVDDISASKRWPGYKYTISTPTKITDDEVTFSLQYEKVNRGSNRFQACEIKRINVNFRRSAKDRLLVDVRQSTTGDATKAITYLKDLAHASSVSVDDPDKFMIDFMSLEALTSRHRVDFFDKFAAEQFEDWYLKTINGMSIKRGKNIENGDEEEDTEDIGEQEITGESNDLAGINQAILNGQALRSNKFVNTCIEQGCYISSMKYHYVMKGDATEYVIAISSKRNVIHVDMVRSYRDDDDDKPVVFPYSKDDQDAIIRIFQEKVQEIYSDLMNVQKAISSG